MAAKGEWQGYGPGWDRLRRQTLERDNYTCQRCGYNSARRDSGVPLQAHHIIPRSEGGPDDLNNLITLCRRCHGVQHPDNEAFDDDRPSAPLFPHPRSDGRVSQMRTKDDAKCSRCRLSFGTNELAGIPGDVMRNGKEQTVCKPCAGVICEGLDDVSVDDLFGRGQPTEAETVGSKTRTHPVPLHDAPSPLNVTRRPESLTERLLVKAKLLRHYATLVVYTLIFAAAYMHFGSDGGNIILAWVAACSLTPIIRWGLGHIVYRVLAAVDPTHTDDLYRPTMGASFSRVFNGIVECFTLSLGLFVIVFVVLIIVAFVLMGLDAIF